MYVQYLPNIIPIFSKYLPNNYTILTKTLSYLNENLKSKKKTQTSQKLQNPKIQNNQKSKTRKSECVQFCSSLSPICTNFVLVCIISSFHQP